MMEWWHAVIIGIVEGITEWLPISSTGHMILVDEFLKLNFSAEFNSKFDRPPSIISGLSLFSPISGTAPQRRDEEEDRTPGDEAAASVTGVEDRR